MKKLILSGISYRMICLLLLLLTWSDLLISQGSLLLLGGGNPVNQAWSAKPLQWALTASKNRRVALIGYAPETSALPDYLLELGANYAKNFYLPTSIQANLPTVIDSLSTYDIILFREGNPWKYYRNYQNSKLVQVIRKKYQAGGVIGGIGSGITLLSEAFFTGEHGQVYPAECLQDILNPYITLADDFLPLLTGYMLEPHFSQQGGLGRLPAFMAKWRQLHGKDIHGVGIDEQTALCLDKSGKGTVWGSGLVHMFVYPTSQPLLSTRAFTGMFSELAYYSFPTGKSFNIQEFSPDLSTHPTNFSSSDVWGHHDLWISGSNSFSDNIPLLNAFVKNIKQQAEPVILVTPSSNGQSESIGSWLKQQGVSEIFYLEARDTFMTHPRIRPWVYSVKNILFTGNDISTLSFFLRHHPEGKALQQQLYKSESRLAFMGDDSRIVGEQYLVPSSSPDKSSFAPGLGLFRNTLIVPNGFGRQKLTSSFFTDWSDSLFIRILLPRQSVLHYDVHQDSARIRSDAEMPFIFLGKNGKHILFSIQDERVLSLGPVSQNVTFTDDQSIEQLSKSDWISIYPNPVKDNLNIFLYGKQSGFYTFTLLDGENTQVFSHHYNLTPDLKTLTIPVRSLPSGMYNLEIRLKGEKLVKTMQVIK